MRRARVLKVATVTRLAQAAGSRQLEVTVATAPQQEFGAHMLRAWEQRADTPPEEAYRDYLLALDDWRHLPYTDPGLPAGLLPADWPGTRSASVFRALHKRLRDAGAEFASPSADSEAD